MGVLLADISRYPERLRGVVFGQGLPKFVSEALPLRCQFNGSYVGPRQVVLKGPFGRGRVRFKGSRSVTNSGPISIREFSAVCLLSPIFYLLSHRSLSTYLLSLISYLIAQMSRRQRVIDRHLLVQI